MIIFEWKFWVFDLISMSNDTTGYLFKKTTRSESVYILLNQEGQLGLSMLKFFSRKPSRLQIKLPAFLTIYIHKLQDKKFMTSRYNEGCFFSWICYVVDETRSL